MTNKAPEIVWLFWLGSDEMSPNRKMCFEQIKKNCPYKINFINNDNINEYIIKDYPLHKAFEFLSGIHKFDYLANYISHHYGGIIINIKNTFHWEIWKRYLDRLNSNNDLFVCSSHGNGPEGITDTVSSGDVNYYKKNWKVMYGHIGWIIKPYTLLTECILNENILVLNKYYNDLKKNPSVRGRQSSNNSIVKGSNYPLPWAILGGGSMYKGNILYKNHIDNSMPQNLVSLNNYK